MKSYWLEVSKEGGAFVMRAPLRPSQTVLTEEEAAEMGVETVEECITFVRETRPALFCFKIVGRVQ